MDTCERAMVVYFQKHLKRFRFQRAKLHPAYDTHKLPYIV